MKKLLLMSGMACLSACSLTPQQKAEKSIKEYLEKNLNDPHSYESVSFSPVFKETKSTSDDSLYKSVEKELKAVKTDLMIGGVNINYPTLYNIPKLKLKMKAQIKDTARLVLQLDSIKKALDLKQIGWQVQHKYRAKNGYGALGVHTGYFSLTMDFTDVKSVINSDN